MKAPTYDEAIGDTIRRAREAAGLTQAQLSARIRQRHFHLVQPKLSRYEKGRSPVPNKLVELVERELGMAPGSIYRAAFGDDSPIRVTLLTSSAPRGITRHQPITAATPRLLAA